MQLNGASIVIETLIAHGITDVFGFPGGAVLNLYDELYKRSDKINHWITCHEQAAAHAADGYARVTGKTGVVIATSGPGATNLVTGIATAYLDSTPLVAITGNVTLPLIGKDSFQEVDILGITIPITKHNYIVKSVDELENILCEAFQIAHSNRPGPVLIDIPKDIQIQMAEFNGGTPWAYFEDLKAYEHKIEKAVQIISESKRPYIYAGGGVTISDSARELAEFADKIDAPIGSSLMGLSAVDCKNPHKLGMTGMHGQYASARMNAECDLIIGVGVRFSDRATGDLNKYGSNKKIIHIDIDKAEINKNISKVHSILGNIKEIMPEITHKINQQAHPEWNQTAKEYQELERKYQEASINDFIPSNIIKLVNKFADADTVVATDVGQHQMWTAQFYQFSNPRTFLTSGGLGTMGFGMGAAIGGSIAKNKARTILFTGDGSFHMNMNEIATTVMHGLPIVVIILDNQVLGMVRQWQGLFYENRFSNTTMERATDYVKLAEAFGANGYKATNLAELNESLTKAFAENAPVIIDCIIDKDEKVLPMIPPGRAFENIIIN